MENVFKELIAWCEKHNIEYCEWNSSYIKGVKCFSFDGSEEVINVYENGDVSID